MDSTTTAYHSLPQPTTASDFYTIRKIVVNSSGEVYASTRNGIYKLGTSPTASWQLSLTVTPSTTTIPLQGNDLELSPNGTIYASLGLGQDELGRIYKLPVGGNWELISGSLPLSGLDKFRRVELACSGQTPSILYALAQTTKTVSTKSITIYKSNDQGATWTAVNLMNLPVEDDPVTSWNEDNFRQASYCLALAVDPNDANRLYVGAYNVYKCKNASATDPNWEQISVPYDVGNYVHPDQHQIVFEPGSSSTAYITCDGGIYYSKNINNSTPLLPAFKPINNNLRVTQFYTLAHTAQGGTYAATTTGTLPNMPVRYAVFAPPTDPNTNSYGYKLLLATETGIWATKSIAGESTIWAPINGGKLPNVRTQMLKYRESDGMLFVATHGRGLWRSDMFSKTQVDFGASVVLPSKYGSGKCQIFTSEVSLGATYWEWDLSNDGSIDAINRNPIFEYCYPEQEIKLTITNSVGEKFAVVKRLNEIASIPASCPSCTVISRFGKQESKNKNINLSIIPNLNQGFFIVKLDDILEKIESIEIYNMTGQLVKTGDILTHEVNLETEPTGIYICRVKTVSGQTLSSKMLKQ